MHLIVCILHCDYIVCISVLAALELVEKQVLESLPQSLIFLIHFLEPVLHKQADVMCILFRELEVLDEGLVAALQRRRSGRSTP